LEKNPCFNWLYHPSDVLPKNWYRKGGKSRLPSYKKLFIWLEENGKKVVGPAREVLLNELDDIPQEEFMTEIYAPIE